MSRLILLILPWLLGTGSPSPVQFDPDIIRTMVNADVFPLERDPGLGEQQDILSEMFKEVKELMEDTQSKLTSAIKEMEAEEGAAEKLLTQSLKNLPPNYHNESITETKVGNHTLRIQEDVVKETDNKTGATSYLLNVITSVKDKKSHECEEDEDCGERRYCNLAQRKYECLPCKDSGECTQAGECCDGQLCVWGKCTKSTKGQSGTICLGQKDCAAGLCCTTEFGLQYPVCAPMSEKGDPCLDSTHFSLNQWDKETSHILDHCPCAAGLTCQSHTFDSICEESSQEDYSEDRAEPPAQDLGVESSTYQDDLWSKGPHP